MYQRRNFILTCSFIELLNKELQSIMVTASAVYTCMFISLHVCIQSLHLFLLIEISLL